MEDAEGDLLSTVRAAVGPGCLIAASYDLHGNLSPHVIGSLDLLSAYRTAPHVDAPQTLERVFTFLVRCLRENLRPAFTYFPVPVLLPGEQTSTEWEPGASLYASIPGVIDGDAVMDASILIGYVWADEPRSSASVVTFGLDAEKVRRAADALACRFWELRGLFQFGAPAASVEVCLRLAASSEERPVVISDSGDNPTAGGAGDTTFVLERMLALGTRDAVLASITDPAAVRRCQAAGEGAILELAVRRG
jgi:microcystin degradation protein MlrC